MLEIKFVRQNLSTLQAALAARGFHAELENFKRCDEERRTLLQQSESLRHQRNVVSDRIAEMKRAGEDAQDLVVEMRDVSSKIKELDKKLLKDLVSKEYLYVFHIIILRFIGRISNLHNISTMQLWNFLKDLMYV